MECFLLEVAPKSHCLIIHSVIKRLATRMYFKNIFVLSMYTARASPIGQIK